MRPIDADAIVFDYNGLAYIGPYNYMDIAKYFADQIARQPTLTPPNEALICDGCLWAEMGALEKCSSCMRDKKDNYYRRPPEGEENHDGLRKAD
jgi:hypothetical protein